jgi:putative hydrolase of the HAD superfamily
MDERPLKHLKVCRATGVRRLFGFLSRSKMRIGVFSDYPAHAKVRALGLADYCSPVLCASDPDIAALKPNPRGFLKACEAWGLPPAEVLMVGDRTDVDGAGAAASGMPCVIITTRPPSGAAPAGVMILDSLERLHSALDDNR